MTNYCRIICVVCILSIVNSLHIFFQEPVHICGTSSQPVHSVSVNGQIIHTDGAAETIGLFVASFLCFNLNYSPQQEGTIQTLEGLLGIRKFFSDEAYHSLVRSIM